MNFQSDSFFKNFKIKFNFWLKFNFFNIYLYVINRTNSDLAKLNINASLNLNFRKTIGFYLMRNVWQVRYLISNWAYSTNHKRISINYFWFVLFAGVVGMVLATIIRLEMAYPGVGILAGDNSQYLSIVTAHGVIMVFFMAMPLLFGFFGNFLLPTQMGVHDVAFPRMNSAAFWFLPASLLALCQLVCIDRRYQRMNCFNIRELQSLLKNKYFLEVSPIAYTSKFNFNSNEYLRYNLNINTSFNDANNSLISFLFNPLKSYNLTTNFIKSTSDLNISIYFNFFYLKLNSISAICIYVLNLLKSLIMSVVTTFSNIFMYLYIINPVYLFTFLRWIGDLNVFLLIKYLITPITSFHLDGMTVLNFFTFNNNNKHESFFTSVNLLNLYKNSTPFSENIVTKARYTTNNFPNLFYKIKTGNYLPGDHCKINFHFLYTTILNKSLFGFKSPWSNSTELLSTIKDDLISILSVNSVYSNKGNLWDSSDSLNFNFNKSSSFYFFNSILNNTTTSSINTTYLNLWYANINTLLVKLYFSQYKQVRVLNNWRELKLHREGWRSRMLSSRHQRSLYRRYVNENEVIWVVEKNAKDLLPGWAMITPFSSRTRYTLVGKTDIGILIVTVTLIASMISSANFLMTYRYLSTLNNRKMRDARSFFTESVIAASWMMIAANPMLILGLLMLISDRHWSTCFFDYSGGGDTVLFQHMFWFFGHPEVYIIIIPCFGIANTLMSFYLRKRISARASLLYSLYTIAFLGFFVWGHHMYMVGLAHTTRMLYSTLTVMISVPAATKIMHWLVTFVNSAVHFELPFILTLLFIFYFVSGGISGMAIAHTGMNILFHDTFYVIGHFHVMLAGSLMFAGFAAVYFYLPSIFGVRYSRLFAYLHVFYYSIGQIFTVIPMIWLGYLGMPRRVLDYPAAMGGWHALVSSAHMITVSGIFAFVLMLFDSLRKQKSYIIKTFGIGRYNTRLNFFLYQAARNRYWFSKYSTLLNVRSVWHNKLEKKFLINNSIHDSTLFYYSFNKFKRSNYGWFYI